MLFTSGLRTGKCAAARRPQTPARHRAGFHPRLEALDDRLLPSTLTVTSTSDSGAGSLRAEIAAAHGGDTIVFDAGLADQTISLTSGELEINKSLTIQGTPGRPEARRALPLRPSARIARSRARAQSALPRPRPHRGRSRARP